MKTQTTSNPQTKSDKTTIPPTLTRALRASIHADKLVNVLFAAGATKLRGTPTEVLEEVAAAQTAAWLVGFRSGTVPGPVPPVPQPDTLEIAMDAVDKDSLNEAGAIVGIQSPGEIDQIRRYLASNLALTAFEAARFASAEERPVCHNCVAIGGSTVARNVRPAGLPESDAFVANR